MKAVVQRVTQSTVSIDGRETARIGSGLLVLLGVARGDSSREAQYLADKVANLRIFEDDRGKMNRSLLDTGGDILVVSQFTLLGDCRKGRRPSFIAAADPDTADALYRDFVDMLRQKGIGVQTGRFRSTMAVSLINDGPVTLILESP